jgi:hypothetical protein
VINWSGTCAIQPRAEGPQGAEPDRGQPSLLATATRAATTYERGAAKDLRGPPFLASWPHRPDLTRVACVRSVLGVIFGPDVFLVFEAEDLHTTFGYAKN